MSETSDRLARNARITLEVSCGVKPDETVVVLTGLRPEICPDRDQVEIYAAALAKAAVALGAHPVVLNLSDFLAGPAFAEGRILEPVRAALTSADVVVNTMDRLHYGQLVNRDENDDEFLTASRRWVFLQSNGMEHWNLTAELVAATRRRTERLIELLGAGREVRVTSPAGTDFTFEVTAPARCTPILGIVPLYGEVAISPHQGTERGTIVVDGPTQQGVRTKDELDREPLRIEVADGAVTGYTGNAEQVSRLKAFIASGDPPAETIDEVGIPTARTLDNDTYWWRDGTHHLERVHIALGNNVQRANIVHGARHMDGEVNRPTVAIDGKVVLEDARFVGPLAD